MSQNPDDSRRDTNDEDDEAEMNPLSAWSSWSRRRRILVVGGLATVAIAAAAVAGYLILKRPGDVSNPDAPFQGANQKQTKAKTVNWPLFGGDPERTKFLNAKSVRPPFRKVWDYERDELLEFAPIVVKNRLYGIYNDGVFFALNTDNGKVIWKRKHGQLNASSPAYSRGRLYAVNLEPGQVLAMNAKNGKVIWQRDLPGRAESSPIVAGGRVYFGTESNRFFALDARNGKTVWEVGTAGPVKAAPAFKNGTLYFGDYGGEMWAVRAKDGKVRWQASDLGVGFGRSGRFYSTPAAAFGRVYVGNVDGRVYSFDEKTGELAWTHSAGDFVYSGVAAVDAEGLQPRVFFGSHDSKFYALDAKTGRERWTANPGGMVSGPATAVGNVVYVSTFSGNETAGFDLKTGRQVFKVQDGQYGPVVSDGRKLYLTGGTTITALAPVNVPQKKFNENKGETGIVPRQQYLRWIEKVKRNQARKKKGAADAAAQDGE